jgi:hypothetical protein
MTAAFRSAWAFVEPVRAIRSKCTQTRFTYPRIEFPCTCPAWEWARQLLLPQLSHPPINICPNAIRTRFRCYSNELPLTN